MYRFYLDNWSLPIAPSKLTMSYKNQNKTINLINDGEVNLIKKQGLTSIEFDALLSQFEYNYCQTSFSHTTPDVYLKRLENLKAYNKPFQFIVARFYGFNHTFHTTNIKVTLEDFTVIEDANNGVDVLVKIRLKQYVDFSTKTCNISIPSSNNSSSNNNSSSGANVSTSSNREDSNSPAPSTQAKSYTVVKGDCLWNIAKSFYGDGNKYTTIYNANKSLIDSDNKGTGNPTYTIYPNQVFTIPPL